MLIKYDAKIDLMPEQEISEHNLSEFLADLRAKFTDLLDLGYTLVSVEGEVIEDFLTFLDIIEKKPQIYLHGFHGTESLQFDKITIDFQEIASIFRLNKFKYEQLKEKLANAGSTQASLPL